MSRIFKFNYNLTRRTGTLHNQYMFLIVSRSVLLRMRNILNKVIAKIKTHILGSVTFSRKSCRFWDNVDEYCTAGEATDDDMAHTHCALDN